MKCEECDAEVTGNRWARIRAYEEGWFEQKDGRAWCPKHTPTWVVHWRGDIRAGDAK